MDKSGLLFLDDSSQNRLLSAKNIDIDFTVDSHPFARGKFAIVKKACRRKNSEVYAAKYIRKRRRTSPEEVWHEVAVLDLCSDCHYIVRLYQVFETTLDTILLLEMAEGGDLQTVLDREEFLEESICIEILRDTLKGLSFLHHNSIAHLDIKPQNLVVSGPLPGGVVKLCDFGLSRKLSITTEIRELIGTPDYVSPEVLSYEPLTLATDCWALGVLTYVLLSGVSPFGGDNKQETFLNISQRELTFPLTYFENVSTHAIDFIEKLLVLRPSDRLTAKTSLKHIWLEDVEESSKNSTVNPNPMEPNNNNQSKKGQFGHFPSNNQGRGKSKFSTTTTSLKEKENMNLSNSNGKTSNGGNTNNSEIRSAGDPIIKDQVDNSLYILRV